MLVQMIDLKVLGDDRGRLVAIEDFEVGFAIRRVYYIFGTQADAIRGLHAHRDLTQVAVALRGRCTFLLDNGRRRETAVLDNPARGLVIGSMVWREMSDFSPDCLLMVLASANYDEADYIRSYPQFLKAVSGDDAPPAPTAKAGT